MVIICNYYKWGQQGNQKQLSLNKKKFNMKNVLHCWWKSWANSDGSSEISNCNMALSGQEEERHKVKALLQESRKGQRRLDQQWGDSAEAGGRSGKEWSGTGWNHEGGTAMARQCWKHNEQENALASSFLLPHSLLPMLPIGQDGQDYQENRTKESENCSSLKCRVNLKKLKEEIGEETGKCHQISYS